MRFFCWNFALETRFFLVLPESVGSRFFKPVSEVDVGGRSGVSVSEVDKNVSRPALYKLHALKDHRLGYRFV